MIVFVGYTTDGFDVFQMPYPASTPPRSCRGVPVLLRPRRRRRRRHPGPSRRDGKHLLPTLKPTSWSPIVESDGEQIRGGASPSGFDVLGYHSYFASATWLVSGPSGAATPNAASPDWQVYYAYDRWRPTFWMSASRETSFSAGPATDSAVPSRSTLRERQIEAGVLFPVRHVRVASLPPAALLLAVDHFPLPYRAFPRNLTAARAAWSVASAHTYSYSISPEDGANVGVTAELVRRELGSSGDATAVTADGRVYFPAFAPHHVFALRLAGGTATGDPTLGRTFHLGGAGPNIAPINFGSGAISLLRGFPADSFAGSRVALMNADYRWAIARPQRGAGTWPVFVHTLHAAVFADAGHAWTRTFAAHDLKVAAGGELSFELIGAYSVPFTVTTGIAWGRDGSHTVSSGATAYVRIGRAF